MDSEDQNAHHQQMEGEEQLLPEHDMSGVQMDAMQDGNEQIMDQDQMDSMQQHQYEQMAHQEML